MKKYCITIILIFLNIISYAQAPTFEWAKNHGGSDNDVSYSICSDLSGNVYITGTFYSSTITFGSTTLVNSGSGDIFIVKYGERGNVIWAKNVKGISSHEEGNGIAVDLSGNVYITGNFNSSKLIFGKDTLINAGGADIFIAKYSPSGNVLWAKKAAGTSQDYSFGITTDLNGNVIITGWFESSTITFGTNVINSSGGSCVFIAKYDLNGNVLWVKNTGSGALYSYNSRGLSADADGNLVITGSFSTTIAFDTIVLSAIGLSDIFIAKYNSDGNIIWAKKAGGTSNESCTGITTDLNRNTIITGGYSSPTINFGSIELNCSGTSAAFIAKYDINGNIVWVKKAGNNIDYKTGYRIAADKYGSIVSAGLFYSNIIFDTDSLINKGASDCFVVKYDSDGTELWVKSIGGDGDDLIFGIGIDSNSNILITGGYNSTKTIFGADTLYNSGLARNDIFIAKLSILLSGINDIKNSNIKIYPNPTNNIINIEGLTKNENNTIQILDVQGKLVITKTITEKGTIDLSELNNGVYVIKIGEVAQRIVKM